MRALPLRLFPFVAFLLGAATVFAFAPFKWWPLQIATLACIFYLVLQANSVKRSALLGLTYGAGWLIACTYWLYISMHDFGGMPAAIAIVAVVALGMSLGLLPALAMSVATWLRQRRKLSDAATLLLVLPALWALIEWMRGWI